jgi:hypothetical protein
MKKKRVKKPSIQNILSRAKGLEPGPVLPEEVEFARTVLRERDGDIWGALYVVGLCGTVKDATLLECYIYDDFYAERAFPALCRHLGVIEPYRPLLRSLILSPPKREEDDIGLQRMSAIHLADRYFDGFDDDELGCALLRIFLDPEDDNRRSVRSALVDILGLRHDLNDPFSLGGTERGDDDIRIAEGARKRFNCKELAAEQLGSIG